MQEQNQRQLAIIRELSSKQENSDAQMRAELDAEKQRLKERMDADIAENKKHRLEQTVRPPLFEEQSLSCLMTQSGETTQSSKSTLYTTRNTALSSRSGLGSRVAIISIDSFEIAKYIADADTAHYRNHVLNAIQKQCNRYRSDA